MSGVFTLKSSSDLLGKLKFDFKVLNEHRDNPYYAFNFFVTAEHMLDWIYPGYTNKSKRQSERNTEVLLRIYSHLANGAKHFSVEAKHHDSVAGTVRKRPSNPFSGPLGGPFVLKRGPSGLYVNLDRDAKNELGPSIHVLDLAKRVLDYWVDHQEFSSGTTAFD